MKKMKRKISILLFGFISFMNEQALASASAQSHDYEASLMETFKEGVYSSCGYHGKFCKDKYVNVFISSAIPCRQIKEVAKLTKHKFSNERDISVGFEIQRTTCNIFDIKRPNVVIRVHNG